MKQISEFNQSLWNTFSGATKFEGVREPLFCEWINGESYIVVDSESITFYYNDADCSEAELTFVLEHEFPNQAMARIWLMGLPNSAEAITPPFFEAMGFEEEL